MAESIDALSEPPRSADGREDKTGGSSVLENSALENIDWHAIEWAKCSTVERDSERVSGAWLFRGTRVPITALNENLKGGASVEDFVAWFPGVSRAAAAEVIGFVAASQASKQNHLTTNAP